MYKCNTDTAILSQILRGNVKKKSEIKSFMPSNAHNAQYRRSSVFALVQSTFLEIRHKICTDVSCHLLQMTICICEYSM